MWRDGLLEGCDAGEQLGLGEVVLHQFGQGGPVKLWELFGRKQPFDNGATGDPRPVDAPVDQCLRVASHGEGAERLVEIPRQHPQLAVGLVHDQIVVVRHADVAVDVHEDAGRGEVGGELPEVHPLADLAGELVVRSLLDQLEQLGELPDLACVLFPHLDAVALVGFRFPAEIAPVVHRLRLHQQAAL